MADLPEPLNDALRELRAAMQLVDDQSEGTYYAALFTAVAHLNGRCEHIIKHLRPGIEVPGALRLPLSPEREDRIVREAGIPDHPPEEEP